MKCEVCQHELAGVSKVFGTTLVCASSACQLLAQTRDRNPTTSKELVVVEKHKGATPVPVLPMYCAAIVAYQGDGKWALGVVTEDRKDCDWFTGLDYNSLLLQIGDISGRIKYHPEAEILSTMPG